jgi:hypothetical protein
MTHMCICLLEKQALASRWRCSAFLAIDALDSQNPTQNDEQMALDFTSVTSKRVISPLLYGVLGKQAIERPFLFKDRGAVTRLGRSVHAWNRDVKSSFMPHDFIVDFVKGGSGFDERVMAAEEGSKCRRTEPVVACIGMGLRSMVTNGPEAPPETVWQCKPIVVTDGYFDLD